MADHGTNTPGTRLRLAVRGTVQGVGFRPYVFGLATRMALGGFVANTSGGVIIEVEGGLAREFAARLTASAPPLARIEGVDVREVEPLGSGVGFEIRESLEGGSFTLVSPDVGLCPECEAELLDPADRRHGYAFINCTNCGPRYSITLRTPYDRPNTTMARFAMCEACREEYGDPLNRRFHAVPNACPACGPRVWLVRADGSEGHEGAVREAASLMAGGKVVAVKGLGGFHLACDAASAEGVGALRARKRGSNKPFALMARDMDAVRRYCRVSTRDEGLLLSARRPVVLLARRDDAEPLDHGIAPGNARLGVMLPYTPLHVMLMHALPSGMAVMTSGNRAEEPMVHTNEAARAALGPLADAWLLHDREIFMRVDDSVVRSAEGLGMGLQFVRRARGYAPEPIALDADGPDVLAMGADLKNTFALTRGRYVVVSQHMGDMANLETEEFMAETLENLKAVYRAEPVAVAHDLHPDYRSTRWAREHAGSLPLHAIQHHYAHIGSVMAEHGLRGPVLGVALDGTGHGTDGTVWGGEFMICTVAGFHRLGHLAPVPMPGGEAAAREPWRMAVTHLRAAYGPDEALRRLGALGLFARVGEAAVRQVMEVAGRPALSPLTSSMGRLFDAASSILGLVDINTFEGEAAMALESAADPAEAGDYAVDIRPGEAVSVDFSYAMVSLVSDVLGGAPVGRVAARFQNSVVSAVRRVCAMLADRHRVRAVALSGGVFLNAHVLSGCMAGLREDGLEVYANSAVPPGDGGISLGQAYLVRERIMQNL
jgi:hydrogenase maturation protein HypF